LRSRGGWDRKTRSGRPSRPIARRGQVDKDRQRAAPSADVQRRLYELMALMKAADDRLSKGIASGELLCVYWPPRGQEAIAAAIGMCLRTDDQLVTTYRGLHDLIAKGVPLTEIQAGAAR